MFSEGLDTEHFQQLRFTVAIGRSRLENAKSCKNAVPTAHAIICVQWAQQRHFPSYIYSLF